MNRILVPLDGSPLAESILPVVEEWAKEEEAEVILLRAAHAHRVPGRDSVEAEVQAVGEAETYLKAVEEKLVQRGLRQVRYSIWYGQPAPAIAEAAVRQQADLIAMATHGRGGLTRLLMGSVASGVVRAVQVPVLLIRGQSAWKPWVQGNILVPLDGSETAEAILPVVAGVAGPRDLAVILLRVLEPPPSPGGQAQGSIRSDEWMAVRRRDAEKYLTKVAEPLRDKGMRVEWAVRAGMAVETIAALAGEERVDLTAMATHARSGLGRFFFGSVAEGVVKAAAVPVLLFKAGERASFSESRCLD